MTDRFVGTADSPSTPARQAFAVTPTDATIIYPLPKAIICGGAGNLVVLAVDSTVAVTIPVFAGQQLDIRAEKIMAATTATNIVGLA